MRFSIIIPSYLGEYKNAARQRPEKLLRALRSCLNQKFPVDQFEVILVADGCERTFDIARTLPDEFASMNFTCIEIIKQPMFSGRVRNRGIYSASGEWILYLDSDDYFGENHLRIISNEIDNLCRTVTLSLGRTIIGKESNPDAIDWVYFNDLILRKKDWRERDIKIDLPGQHGTSNVAHKRSLNAFWNAQGYGKDDTYFILSLRKKFPNFKKIKTPEYHVCHIPGFYDK